MWGAVRHCIIIRANQSAYSSDLLRAGDPAGSGAETASRNMFYNESGNMCGRKEILDEN